MTRALIAAGGPTDKWRAHFQEIEGERLMDRTVRQFARFAEVAVVGHAAPSGVRLEEQQPIEEDHYGNLLLGMAHLFGPGRTIVVLGDTWFSEAAIARIQDEDSIDPRWYGRWGPSKITGAPWGELFALSFYAEDAPWLVRAQIRLSLWRRQGRIWRSGLWELLRLHDGVTPVDRHTQPTPSFVEIDDWTDDFDTPEELAEWLRRRS